MNKLFRTIKENDNLDYLEESDDEEEFENISSDKYVDTNKVVKINYYNKNRLLRYIRKMKVYLSSPGTIREKYIYWIESIKVQSHNFEKIIVNSQLKNRLI